MKSNLISLAGALVGTTLLCTVVASPAQAFRIGGGAVSSRAGSAFTVDFNDPASLTDGDAGQVTAPSGVIVSDLVLSLGSGIPIPGLSLPGGMIFENASNLAIPDFVTGFTYNGVSAVFDLFASTDATLTEIPTPAGLVQTAFDLTFNGVIRDASGSTILARVNGGTFSTTQNSVTNDFSMSLPTQEVPTPALLPGLLGMGMAITRKRKQVEAAA